MNIVPLAWPDWGSEKREMETAQKKKKDKRRKEEKEKKEPVTADDALASFAAFRFRIRPLWSSYGIIRTTT